MQTHFILTSNLTLPCNTTGVIICIVLRVCQMSHEHKHIPLLVVHQPPFRDALTIQVLYQRTLTTGQAEARGPVEVL